MRLSEDRIYHLSHLITDALVQNRNVDVIQAEERLLREIRRTITEELKFEDEADVADVEFLAGTTGSFVRALRARIAAKVRWSTIYGTDATIATAAAELASAGPHGWYYRHVDCWLANWNLDEAQAAALTGGRIHGLACRAVQWASPTSNPGTIVPGGTLTLAQAQVDLSVAEDAWHPAPG